MTSVLVVDDTRLMRNQISYQKKIVLSHNLDKYKLSIPVFIKGTVEKTYILYGIRNYQEISNYIINSMRSL